MRIRPLIFVFLAAFCVVLPVRAPRAQDAGYAVTVPVNDTSDAQRDHAFAVALGEVLIRTAGQDITDASGYTDALGSAANLVQNYRYQRASTGSSRPYLLRVDFDSAAVRQLAGSLRKQIDAAAATAAGAGAGVTQGGSGKVWVSNVHSAMDLARLLAAFHGDSQVVSAAPVGADGSGVMLDVRTSAPLPGVLGDLQAKGHLQQDAVSHAGADASVSWLR